ncbi:hypothetical protein BC826DRAFT_725616 [Russula brevipes]|nr:hypothetical protein BC826DRAFT_725616 [Russula brevipes]
MFLRRRLLRIRRKIALCLITRISINSGPSDDADTYSANTMVASSPSAYAHAPIRCRNSIRSPETLLTQLKRKIDTTGDGIYHRYYGIDRHAGLGVRTFACLPPKNDEGTLLKEAHHKVALRCRWAMRN